MTRWVLFSLLAAAGLASDWPQFRGPAGSGVGQAQRLPVEFGPRKNVAWRTELPAGHSSPVIWGNRIFLTAADPGARKDAGLGKIIEEGGKLYTICIDRVSGKILWKREAPRPRLERYQPTNSPASPSAVTDGKFVYVFFGDYGLLAYDLDGGERWKLPLGPFNNQNGHGSSPILYRDLLILLCDQDTGSYLIAVNKNNGRVAWKVDRPEVTRSYTTPAIVKPARGPDELVIPGAYQLTAYDPLTGKKLWWIGGMSWQPKSVPVVDGDIVYAHWWESGGEAEAPTETPSFAETAAKFDADGNKKITQAEFAADPRLQRGFPNNDLDFDGFVDEREWEAYRLRRASRNALLAVRAGGRGDLSDSPNILWRMQKFLPNVPSPLLYQGVMYLVKDGGIFTALDPKTGQILKQGRLTGALDTYYASPVGGAGHVYVISQTGKMTVLKAGAEWEILALNDFEEDAFATPAIIGNALYVRSKSALYCFRAE
jgi:outer membrane protein assembly factor BamB